MICKVQHTDVRGCLYNHAAALLELPAVAEAQEWL